MGGWEEPDTETQRERADEKNGNKEKKESKKSRQKNVPIITNATCEHATFFLLVAKVLD